MDDQLSGLTPDSDTENNPAPPTRNSFSDISSPQKRPIEPKPTEPAPASSPVKIDHAHKFVYSYLLLIVIILIVGGVYTWQHDKVNSLQKKLASLQAATKTNPAQPTSPVKSTAITDTWTGAGTTPNWSNSSNWSSGVPINNDNLIFNYATAKNIDVKDNQLNSDNDLTGITLDSITFEGGGVYDTAELTGNPIKLLDGINDKMGNSAVADISLTLNLAANQTFTSSSGLVVNPGLPNNTTTTSVNLGTYALTLDSTSNGGTTIYSLAGSGKLVDKSNKNSINIILGASTGFTGPTQISSGVLAVIPTSLGTGTITVSSGATLRIGDSSATSSPSTTFTISNPLVLSGDGTNLGQATNIGAINVVTTTPSTNITLGGKVTLNGNAELGVSGTDNKIDGPGTYTLSQGPTTNGFTLSGIGAVKVTTP
jgi:hypothetical protein